MNYRKEVDGLRAVALLPVIFFHAGFRLFSGGFVGVDVFFVISGYLITSIIISEKHAGTFTLSGFYERRARRILPALFLVMTASLPFATIWLLPRDLADFSRALVAVSLYSSNILFFLKTGYFDSGADLSPFLHTWSLAVEEQYYLIFPLFLASVWKLGNRAVMGTLCVISSMSLVAADWASRHHPTAAFFLLPTRCWEILLGAIIACYLFQRKRATCRTPVCDVFGAIGIVMILFSVFFFDQSTPFPGRYTLVPTVGTALILLFAAEGTLVAKLLGTRPLVGIGLISYSAYLWHQPLFAFARHRSIEEPAAAFLIGLIFIALLLAVASWKWVEKPFRDRRRILRKDIVVFGVLGSTFFIAIGLVGHWKDGFVQGVSPQKMRLFAAGSEARALYRERTCLLGEEQTYTDFAKECRAGSDRGGVLLWGDSHAAALAVGLRALVPSVTQYTATGCPPLKDVNIRWRAHCKDVNDYVIREIQRSQPAAIIMHANWISYRDYPVADAARKTLEYLRTLAPSSEFVFIGGVPQWPAGLPKFLLLKGVGTNLDTYIETPSWEEIVKTDELLKARTNGARFVSALDSLCRNRKCLAVTAWHGTPTLVIWDDSHLTEAGSVLLARRVTTDFATMPSQD